MTLPTPICVRKGPLSLVESKLAIQVSIANRSSGLGYEHFSPVIFGRRIIDIPGVFNGHRVPSLRLVLAISLLEKLVRDTHGEKVSG